MTHLVSFVFTLSFFLSAFTSITTAQQIQPVLAAQQGAQSSSNSIIVKTQAIRHVSAATYHATGITGQMQDIGLGYAVLPVSQAGRALAELGPTQAWPNRIVSTSTTNDPLRSFQWDLDRLQVENAWSLRQPLAQGQGTIVAILDTGISPHPDLADDIVIDQANFTESPDTGDHYSFQGHGTMVAGIISATPNNRTGIAGIAPRAKLLNGKVLDDYGSGSEGTVIPAIIWAANQGAHVINMSLGAPFPTCDQPMQDAVDYAWRKGTVIVGAAGNEHRNGIDYPAICEHIIPVGSSNPQDEKEPYSNYGIGVIFSPAEVLVGLGINPRYPYTSANGTSSATPHIAGIAAIMKSAEPTLSNADIVRFIRTTAEGSLPRVNAFKAVSRIPAPCSPRPPILVESTRITPEVLSVRVTISRTSFLPGNTFTELPRFGTITNADVDVPIFQPGTMQVSFTVHRQHPGSVTIPFIVTDACGDWRTFVGSGANAF